ncbi:MAG: hypothetical protein SOX97_09720 [Sutterella sp.]|nr:hypothetical protein [Sutterella sp.]
MPTIEKLGLFSHQFEKSRRRRAERAVLISEGYVLRRDGRLERREDIPKQLLLIPGAGHVDLYDRTDLIPFEKIDAFFRRHL